MGLDRTFGNPTASTDALAGIEVRGLEQTLMPSRGSYIILLMLVTDVLITKAFDLIVLLDVLISAVEKVLLLVKLIL
jgi:hypothetical protein